MKNQENDNKPSNYDGLWFGAFILVASLLTLGEYLGFVPKDLQWGLPTFGIIVGLAFIVKAVSKKR